MMIGGEVFECQDTRLLPPSHLYHRLPHGLTGLDVFDKRIKFRPSTTDSKTHKKVSKLFAEIFGYELSLHRRIFSGYYEYGRPNKKIRPSKIYSRNWREPR